MTKPERSYIDLDRIGSFAPKFSDPLFDAERGRWLFADGTSLPFIGGGDGAPVANPLGPPTATGNTLTIDTMLKQPTRITSMLLDLTLQRFIADRIFSSNGGVTGGAVIYDQLETNDLYTDRDVGRVAPGAEFPLVTGIRRAPKVAEVEKWGGKFYITDEAKDRNDTSLFTNLVRQLANTIVKKLNERALAKLEEEIAARAGALSVVGHNWGTAIPNGNNPTAPNATPGADLRRLQTLADIDELGIQYDTLIVNPAQAEAWNNFYQGRAKEALNDNGIREMFASNRVAAGVAYAVASKQVGEMRMEQPLGTTTEREGAPTMRERTWVQSSVRPLFLVNNPFAVRKLTGLAG
jgi:hypothetical protein